MSRYDKQMPRNLQSGPLLLQAAELPGEGSPLSELPLVNGFRLDDRYAKLWCPLCRGWHFCELLDVKPWGHRTWYYRANVVGDLAHADCPFRREDHRLQLAEAGAITALIVMVGDCLCGLVERSELRKRVTALEDQISDPRARELLAIARGLSTNLTKSKISGIVGDVIDRTLVPLKDTADGAETALADDAAEGSPT